MVKLSPQLKPDARLCDGILFRLFCRGAAEGIVSDTIISSICKAPMKHLPTPTNPVYTSMDCPSRGAICDEERCIHAEETLCDSGSRCNVAHRACPLTGYSGVELPTNTAVNRRIFPLDVRWLERTVIGLTVCGRGVNVIISAVLLQGWLMV